MINRSLTIGNIWPNQNRPLRISKSGGGSGSPSRLAQTATYWRYDPIYRSFFCARNSRMVATILVVVAHFGLGIARSTIRTDALVGIIFVGIALAGSTLLKRDK